MRHDRIFAVMTAVLLALSCGSQLSAQEWTRFRGPNGTGVSDAKTVPTTWTENDYAWKTELPASGHSSPVLWGEKIFLTCADDTTTARRMVVCINAVDGSLLWKKEYASEIHRKHKFNSFASSTPAVDADHVYVSWSTPDSYSLIALDHRGKEVWERDLGPYVSQHSCGTSPVVYGDMVVLGNDQDLENETAGKPGGKSFLIAVDRQTGSTRWEIQRRSARVAYSTPCVYRPKEGGPEQLIFNSMSHGVTSVNPKDGSVNWEIDTVEGEPLLDKRSVSSPVLLPGGLITASCGSGAGGNYLVAIQPGSKDKQPKLVYKIDQRDAAPYVPTPLEKDGLLFLWSDKGVVACFDASSGKRHWIKRVGGNYFGSPVCVDNRLFCVSTDGDVVVLAASKEYNLLAKNELGELCHSTPAVADGKMFIHTYRHLIAVGGKQAK